MKSVMKNKIRRELKEKRLKLSEDDRRIYSLNLFRQVLKLDIWDRSQNILSYCSFRGELETDFINKEILLQGKNLLLPKTDIETNTMKAVLVKSLSDIQVGNYGIKEPRGSVELEPDLIIVPAIAYDKEGNRIGYGGGYYDRYLEGRRAFKLGVIYDFQLLDKVEVEEHDIGVDLVIAVRK